MSDRTEELSVEPARPSDALSFSDVEPVATTHNSSATAGLARPDPFAADADARTDFRDRPALGA
jgi:hypothetical protein